MLRLTLPLVAVLILLPLLFGTAGVLLPAFGYNPAVASAASFTAAAEPASSGAGNGRQPVALTLTTGIAATLLSLAICLLIVSCCWQTRWWAWVRASLPPVLAIPHVAFAIGLVFLFSPSGWLVRLLTPWLTGWQRPPDWQVIQDPLGLALTLAMVLKETPFLLLMCLAAFSQIDIQRQMWIGRSLGYRPVTVWWKLLIPQLYPLIRLPVLAVLVYSLSVVDMAILLGPNRPPTFAVVVFEWFREPDLALLNRAAAGALRAAVRNGFAYRGEPGGGEGGPFPAAQVCHQRTPGGERYAFYGSHPAFSCMSAVWSHSGCFWRLSAGA
jgi:putative thiamine transport system permease protein